MTAKHYKCCCPEATCDVFFDDFNRPDSTNLGSGWAEVSGDASIDSNQLLVNTEGNIVVTARQPAPEVPSAKYNVRLAMDLIAGQSEYSIICGFVDDSNYDWIRLTEDGTTGDWFPEFIRTTGGADVVLMDITTHPEGGPLAFSAGVMSIDICYAPLEWSIQADTETKWVMCDQGGKGSLPTDPGHGLVGVRNGRFDNFDYDIHWESDHDCNTCTCFCFISSADYICLKEELTLTLVPTSGPECWDTGLCGPSGEPSGVQECCDAPETMTYTLYQRNPDITGPTPDLGPDRKTPNKRIWYTEIMPGENGSDPLPDNLWAALVCDIERDRIFLGFQCYDNIITDLSPGCPAGGGDVIDKDPITGYHANVQYFEIPLSTCDPLNLVFGDIQFTRSACSQCASINGTPNTYGVNGLTYRPVVTE